MKATKKPRIKTNWENEWNASRVIYRIEKYLDTYWDEDYKLWLIKDEIKKWRQKEI